MVYQYDGNDVGVFTPGIFVALSTNMLQLFIKRQLFSDQGWPAYVPLIGWPAYVPPNCSMRRTRRRLLMTGFSSVQLLSHVWLFATPWTPACQASLSITNSQSLLKLMPIELVVPSNHLILCCPLLSCPQSFPASGSFTMSQFFASGGQSIGVSASTSVLPVNMQDWSLLGWTRWISLQSKELSKVFSNITVQKDQFFGAQLSSQSNSHNHTWLLEKQQPWLDRPLLTK